VIDEEILDLVKNYEICDAHAHIFPDKIAEKAVSAIGSFYDIPMDYPIGTSEHLLKSGSNIGVSHYLVCSTATVPQQVVSINNFIIEECKKHPEFVGFGTLHPDFEDIEGEVERCIENGLRGIKLHPDFQKFYIDDDKAFKIYEAIRGRLPVLIHMGDNRYDFSKPKRLENVVRNMSDLKVFAAHLGGYESWDEAITCLYYDNIRFDTCSSLEFITPEFARDIIYGFGVNKVFFGTDFPMWDHAEELLRFKRLNLTDSENRLILGENFKKEFNL